MPQSLRRVLQIVVTLSFISMSSSLRIGHQWGWGQPSCEEMQKVVVCTEVKNEGAYLPEWIAYHKQLGVDLFEIYDKGSTDGTEHLAEMFAAHDKPYVKVTRTKLGQPGAFTDCVERHKDADVVGVFDVDEFMVVGDQSHSKCPPLKAFLAKAMEGYDEIMFPALRFSSNGQFESYHSQVKIQVEQERKLFKKRNSELEEVDCSVFSDPKPLLLSGQSKACLKVSGGSVPTITGTRLHRGPSKLYASENFDEVYKADPVCTNKTIPVNPCSHGTGKSFVRPKACTQYNVHSCNDRKMPFVDAALFGGRMNHYYIRSAEDACKHDGFWSGPKYAKYWQYSDDTFMHTVEDDSAKKYVDHSGLQAELDSFKC